MNIISKLFYFILAITSIVFMYTLSDNGSLLQDQEYEIIHTKKGDNHSYDNRVESINTREKYGLLSVYKGDRRVILNPVYDAVDGLDESYYRIKLNNKFGLVFKEKLVLRPIYDRIIYFNKFLISFYPHLLLFNIKVYYFWVVFAISVIMLFALLLFYTRFRDFTHLYYFSNARKNILKIYRTVVAVSSFLLFPVFFSPGLSC